MKKFDIKWLLILVLVVILAFGLVACGNKGGGSETPEEEEQQKPVDPNKSDAAEFFATLWDASKSLGAETVNPETDKVHIGMAMDISLTSENVSELDVGVKLGLVADLKAINIDENLGDTALMLQAYDKKTNANWITLWYFMKDESKIYLRVQDQNLVVAFDAYWNKEFTSLLSNVLHDKQDFLNKKAYSLLDLINGIAKTGGSSWTLDSLILGDKSKGFDGLLSAFGLNLSELLESLPEGLLGKGTDTNSLGSILKAMGGVVVESSSCKKYTNADGSKTYTANKLSTTATTLLNGFTDNLFKSISSLSLTYNVTSAGAIDDLIITIAGKKDLSNAEIKIAITDLTIEKVNNKEATEVLEKANSYSPYAKIAFEGYMDASAWKVKLDPDLDGNTQNIEIGKVKINLDATIDLTGSKTENKTAAKLTITNDIGGTSPEKVLTATYKQNTLTLQADLSTTNNKAIAIEALYPLAKLIKEAAVGKDAIVAYKIFGDMAQDILDKMFTKADPTSITDVNGSFSTISITGVDIAVLAKGAFYAIFSGFATGSDNEKPAEAADLTTFDGDKYKLGSYTYEKGQYAWSLDIKQTAATVLKAINYDSKTAANASDPFNTAKDYSINLSSIAATLKAIFKKASVESVEKTKENVDAPANVDEMMALFMCTNDGILLDMTRHGLLPLCKKNTDGIAVIDNTKYITDSYTTKQAAADGYYAISGKMISKENASAIWAFLTSSSNTPQLTLTANGGITVGTYYDVDDDKETIKDYVQNSTIQWFVKFINGTQLVNGMTAANIVTSLTGTNSGLSISLNRETGAMKCDVKLNGASTKGYITYKISGASDAYDVTAIDTSAIEDGNKVVVNLDDKFYALFNAAFGMGPTTKLANGHGLNTDFYYVASAVDYDTTKKVYNSVTYTKGAIILVDATHCYVLDSTGAYSALSTFAIADGVLTVNGTDAYTIYGNSYKVVKAIPQP